MFIGNNVSWFYFISGIISSLFVSIFSYKIGLITKKTKFLFLSFGFYRHFLVLYFENFFKSFILIINLLINRGSINPVIYKLKITNDDHKIDPSLLIASINLMIGLMVIEINQKYILIHAIDEQILNKVNFKKLKKKLLTVNDDELV
jgi:multisubunit Na+/H+ antiporter MnhE subunit